MFIVDMHAPGVTVRPLKVATGHSPFNEVFFDNVRMPADALIGEENKGWDAAVVMLRHERIAIGTMGSSRTSPLAFDSLRELAAGLGRTSDQGVRRSLAELYAKGQAPCSCSHCCCARRRWRAGCREPAARWRSWPAPSSDGTPATSRRTCSAISSPGSTPPTMAAVTTSIIAAPGSAIAGGTSEIQRNIIGERVLGLAKDPGVDRSTPFNQLRVGTQRQN